MTGSSPAADDYIALRDRIRRYLRNTGVGETEADDVADETISRALRLRRAPDDISNPLAYLLTMARNEWIDRVRSNREALPAAAAIFEGSLETDDDALLKILDEDLNLRTVQAALALASREDDVTCLLVVQTWLDLAADFEADPSTRDVGRDLGIAHTTVQRAMRRFQSYVEVVRKNV